jgi:hypothetical protein
MSMIAMLVTACGSSSGSGVSSSKKLTTLSESEQSKLCSYTIHAQGGPRTVTCGDGRSVEIVDEAACVMNLGHLTVGCAATVDDAETCAEAMGADPCNFDVNACGPTLLCVLGF